MRQFAIVVETVLLYITETRQTTFGRTLRLVNDLHLAVKPHWLQMKKGHRSLGSKWWRPQALQTTA